MEKYQKKLESNIWKIYLYQVLYGLMFYTPIIILFYQDNGLSLTQIMIIQSFSSIAWVLLEIPSGYFADICGRKKSLLLNAIFAVLAMLAFGLGNNFYHFLLAALLWALAGVCISGADSAFIYDTLKELKKEHLYKKVWGNVVFCSLLGISAASIIGGFLGGINFRYTFFASVLFYLFLIPLALSLHEPNRYKIIATKNHFYQLLIMIKKSVFQNKKIRKLFMYSAIITSSISIAYFLYQPYFKLSGLDVAYFGLVFATFGVIEAFSAKYSHLIEKKIGQNFSMVILFIVTSLCYILMGKIIFVFSFIIAFLFKFINGFAGVVISDYVQKETDSSIRATVLSVQSFFCSICGAIIAPLIGWLVDLYTLPQALIIIGVVIFVVGGVLSISFWKNIFTKKEYN